MRILVAPDKFKGTLGAPDVARAIKQGAQRVFPEASVDILPMADGGEGTVAALLAALGGEAGLVSVTGPLGNRVDAELGRLADGRFALEMSSAAGLALRGSASLDPLRASSRGAGELVREALDKGAAEILVGVGGSASTDGGTGAASALGWRFLDGFGRDLAPGGGALRGLARIERGSVDPRLARCRIRGLCDVDNPLLGSRGAARVFGPQKGASPAQVEDLEAGLSVLAERIRAELGLEVAPAWGAGAGGGMGAGLQAFLGADLEPGFEALSQAAGLGARVGAADLVVTGEGRLDEQSLAGKVAVGVARIAAGAGVRCIAVAGGVALDRRELRAAGFDDAASLLHEVGDERSFDEPAAAIAETLERLLRR